MSRVLHLVPWLVLSVGGARWGREGHGLIRRPTGSSVVKVTTLKPGCPGAAPCSILAGPPPHCRLGRPRPAGFPAADGEAP